MLQVQKFVFYFFEENTYVVWDESGQCVIIDPGCEMPEEREKLYSFIDSHRLKPAMILLTHAHLDHIYGVKQAVQRYDIPVMMDEKETKTIEYFEPDFARYRLHRPEDFAFKSVTDGDVLHFGNSSVRALSTPGHSPGGLCWWFEADSVIFTGDTLFKGSVGRTDFGCSNLDDLMNSLRNVLMQLDGEIDVYPGHGPSTSIGIERATNPFIYEDYTIEELLQSSRNE